MKTGTISRGIFGPLIEKNPLIINCGVDYNYLEIKVKIAAGKPEIVRIIVDYYYFHSKFLLNNPYI